MERIDKILKASLAKKGLTGATEGAQICFYAEKWGKIHFKPISFSRGVLKVSVLSSSGASELQMQSEELLFFINDKLGQNKVKYLRIVNNS